MTECFSPFFFCFSLGADRVGKREVRCSPSLDVDSLNFFVGVFHPLLFFVSSGGEAGEALGVNFKTLFEEEDDDDDDDDEEEEEEEGEIVLLPNPPGNEFENSPPLGSPPSHPSSSLSRLEKLITGGELTLVFVFEP